MKFPQKIKMEVPYDPVISFGEGVFTKENKTLFQKDICTSMFTAALFTIAKIGRQPKSPSIEEWINRM